MRLIACLTALFWLCALPAWAERVTVFAASSLTSVLTEIAAHVGSRPATAVPFPVPGTAASARQFRSGAPAEFFLSANPGGMDAVSAEIVPGTRNDLLGTLLVLIAPTRAETVTQTAAALGDRLRNGPLAMALVDAVPAGTYGKAALRHLGLWEPLAAQVAQTDNVRAALALVAPGEAPLGIVYATDALVEPRVRVLATFDPASHPPIRYPVAALTDRSVSRAFLAHLAAARAVFKQHGFEVLP